MALRSERDLVVDTDGDRVHIGRAVGVVDLDDHLHHLSRHVSVLLKRHRGVRQSLADAATALDLTS